MARPNVLLVMTDEERYPPPYEQEALADFRRTQLPARDALRQRGVELHRHYAGSTACVASRATLFTGQYPSLHGVSQTDGLGKGPSDAAMSWLDPSAVPTLGDWFRAGGYQTHYRGKWHISHADLPIAGTHTGLMASDADGNLLDAAVAAYRTADRLDPFGFSGWIGREPHGAAKADSGMVRDGVFAEQVTTLFADLASAETRDQGPWLAVASFVNPHDIAFSGFGWDQLLGMAPPDDSIPDIAEAPSQSDSFDGRPGCHAEFEQLWGQMIYPQPADVAYRRLYHYLHQQVDRAIGRILEALEQSGLADDTIVVFTSDHGDLLGAHGGMQQKWHNGFDEAIRVPMLVAGPGIERSPDGIQAPTSHVDVIPTLLGLAGVDVEQAAAALTQTHTEVHPLVGRDLSGVLQGSAGAAPVGGPIYFMTEDDVSRGDDQTNVITGEAFDNVKGARFVETVVTELPTGADGAPELWKLNHYYEALDEWNADHGLPVPWRTEPVAESLWELHNLTADPEERVNRAVAPSNGDADARSQLTSILEAERDAKRVLPTLRNPA